MEEREKFAEALFEELFPQLEPDPQNPLHTKIPEMRAFPFTQEDFDQILEILQAVAPIQARGMKVVTRIELAAAFLASAIESAYDAAEELGGFDAPEDFFDLALDIVVRRAKEIYGQGSA